MEYIEKVDSRPLYGDGIGQVSLWDFSRANENEESRIEAVSTIASVCYGKPPKDATKLAARLMSENASTLEFIRAGTSPGIVWSLRNNPPLDTDHGAGILCGVRIAYIQDAHKKNIATFKLKAPIFVARQIMRHRAFSYQERSLRFTAPDMDSAEFWFPDARATRDNSALMLEDHNAYAKIYEEQMMTYLRLLKRGLPGEVARAVLGAGLYTEFWLMGEVSGLKNYFKLRTDKHAQEEHQEAALAMLDLLAEYQYSLYLKVKP